jgi:hypothetical protein
MFTLVYYTIVTTNKFKYTLFVKKNIYTLRHIFADISKTKDSTY